MMKIVFFSLKIVFVLVDSVDHGEMSHYATFHLGIHCCQSMYLGVADIE